MAYRNNVGGSNMVVSQGGTAIALDKNARLKSLERKLNLVAAAEGKTRSDVVADALDAYLPTRWKNIVAEYQKGE